MPSWPVLMHALSNVSWQLVRGQFDTITISALCWKWFASARYDMWQDERTNMQVGKEWGGISNTLFLEKHTKKCMSECQRKKCTPVYIIHHVLCPIRVDSFDVSCDLPVCCCHCNYSEMLIFCQNLYKVIWLTGADGLNLCRVWFSALEFTLILTFKSLINIQPLITNKPKVSVFIELHVCGYSWHTVWILEQCMQNNHMETISSDIIKTGIWTTQECTSRKICSNVSDYIEYLQT